MALTSLLRPAPLFLLAALLRLALLLYGTWQDAHSAVKYTDIDYLVFTDAARLVSRGRSPYARDTYRYTPLLAWLLLPTTARAPAFAFAFGKLVFAAADLLAGWLALRVLARRGVRVETAGGFAALWLWNPMVAAISTRGSSEGLLGVLTMALLWAVEGRRVGLAGVVLGLGVHFKIYPFIYAPAIVWWMDDENMGRAKAAGTKPARSLAQSLVRFCSPDRIRLAVVSLATFTGLNLLMYSMYVLHSLPAPNPVLNLTYLQTRQSIPRPHIPPPRHPHRPPPQLLPVQHPALPHLGRPLVLVLILPAHRVPRLHPAASPLLRPHPPRPRKEGPRHVHDGPDLCLCHL